MRACSRGEARSHAEALRRPQREPLEVGQVLPLLLPVARVDCVYEVEGDSPA